MNINIIKHIVETYTVEQLQKSEQDLLDGKALEIEIEGVDEGEQLTHILAGIFCKQTMQESNQTIQQAVRAYSIRVRSSIN